MFPSESPDSPAHFPSKGEKKKKRCDNRDFTSFSSVSDGQQGLKRLVALRIFPNNVPVHLRKKGKSRHEKHLVPLFPAEHRAISKVVAPAEASVPRCPHTLPLHAADKSRFQLDIFQNRTERSSTPISLQVLQYYSFPSNLEQLREVESSLPHTGSLLHPIGSFQDQCS